MMRHATMKTYQWLFLVNDMKIRFCVRFITLRAHLSFYMTISEGGGGMHIGNWDRAHIRIVDYTLKA